MSSQTISIDLDRLDIAHLRHAAARRGMSLRDYLTEVVSRQLAQELAPLPAGQALQRASQVVN